jgi:hypothetical protein
MTFFFFQITGCFLLQYSYTHLPTYERKELREEQDIMMLQKTLDIFRQFALPSRIEMWYF